MKPWLFRDQDKTAEDRRYLRLIAIRRLLRCGHIEWKQAFILADRRVRGYHNTGFNGLCSTLEIWQRNGFPKNPKSMTLSELARGGHS